MSRLRTKLQLLFTIGAVLLAATAMQAARQMENLGRGVVGVRTGASSIFVSWRLLGLDPAGIGFNLYRSTAGGTAVKLNSAVLTAGTCYTDTNPDITKDNAYYVTPVINGVEQAASGSYTVKANTTAEPCIVVPLKTPATGYYTKFVWVGDLDGDGEYDFVIDRLAPGNPNIADTTIGHQFVEAYKRDGTRLWSIDLGPGSTNTYNISPGPSTISMGMYDGVTVYDLAGTGKSVVALKVANGVKFGDGTVFSNSDPNKQFLAIVDGQTGKMISNIAFPTDYYTLSGKYGCQLGVAYLDGTTPSVIGWLRNRNSDKSFNDIFVAWHLSGTTLSQTWKLLLPAGTPNVACDHQMVIADVDGDGKDEICPGNFLINPNGTVRYTLPGVIHGDRHYIAKMDPNRAGLQHYGIQQDNSSGLAEYYNDANTGAILWTHMFSSGDVARGLVGHLDPRYKGWDCWSWYGIYFAPQNLQLTVDPNKPYPCHTIWWDGDLLTENLNDSKLEKWDYIAQGTGSRLLLLNDYESATISGHNPMFMGDILGDWRTEIVCCSGDYTKLVIFTTDVPTSTRIYTMAHNPEHRNCWTIKGYYESALVDYYLGTSMSTPPVPNIIYVGGGGGGGGTIANGTYTLINHASGLALDNLGMSTNGAPVGQWTDGSSNNQKWVVTLQSDGYYKLSCVTGGLYLDGMGGTTNGAPVGQWAKSSNYNQEWSIVAAGSYYKLVNRTSNLRLDSLGLTANGSLVGQWADSSANNQQWSFVTP